MKARIYQVDAFTSALFGGNPAAVVILERFPPDAVMQAIAAENNLAETAFLVPDGADYRLRWFTPVIEVPLCGHATLASAAVVLERLSRERRSVTFLTASGALHVTRSDADYRMDLPARPSVPLAVLPGIEQALHG